jgi:hypothetical protein
MSAIFSFVNFGLLLTGVANRNGWASDINYLGLLLDQRFPKWAVPPPGGGGGITEVGANRYERWK